ncbi:MAG: putative beta-lysine N-acetyltransferase [Anaerobacillus sp.]|uniref:putative beta-lysine N-acetyltransferase n=1 Tax=Anaerobacillus sp. TaxID=1872506 RepID=UPI00391DA073
MNVPYLSRTETGADFFIEVYLDFVNERIRIDDYRGNINSVITRMKALAAQYSFTKEIIKSRVEDWPKFLSRGYELEGMINGYFNGSDAFFMVNYASDDRRTSDCWKAEDDLLDKIVAQKDAAQPNQLPTGYSMRLANVEDCKDLANLYGLVFQTYPTPMNEPSYIKDVMEEGTIFKMIEWNGQVVSAASAEVNETYHNAEMTDCATLLEHRKYGFMQLLISALEDELISRNIYFSYSLARAQSYGMNACLQKLGYLYSGRLANNCIMNDNFENMNIWVKKLV